MLSKYGSSLKLVNLQNRAECRECHYNYEVDISGHVDFLHFQQFASVPDQVTNTVAEMIAQWERDEEFAGEQDWEWQVSEFDEEFAAVND